MARRYLDSPRRYLDDTVTPPDDLPSVSRQPIPRQPGLYDRTVAATVHGANNLMNSMTLGGGKYLAGAADALMNPSDMGNAYTTGRDEFEASLNHYRKDYPLASVATGLLGGLISGMGIGKAIEGTKVGAQALRNDPYKTITTIGGLEGAIEGYLTADENTLGGKPGGGMAGLALGATLAPAVQGVGDLARRFFAPKKAAKEFTEMMEDSAGKPIYQDIDELDGLSIMEHQPLGAQAGRHVAEDSKAGWNQMYKNTRQRARDMDGELKESVEEVTGSIGQHTDDFKTQTKALKDNYQETYEVVKEAPFTTTNEMPTRDAFEVTSGGGMTNKTSVDLVDEYVPHTMEVLGKRPAIKSARRSADKYYANKGEVPDTESLDYWDRVYKDLGNQAENARSTMTSTGKRTNEALSIDDARRELRAEITRQHPQYGQALEEFAQAKSLTDAADSAQKMFRKKASDFNEFYGGLNEAEKEAAKSGVMKDIGDSLLVSKKGKVNTDLIKGSTEQNMRTVFGDEQTDQIIAQFKRMEIKQQAIQTIKRKVPMKRGAIEEGLVGGRSGLKRLGSFIGHGRGLNDAEAIKMAGLLNLPASQAGLVMQQSRDELMRDMNTGIATSIMPAVLGWNPD